MVKYILEIGTRMYAEERGLLVKNILEIGTRMVAEERGFFGKEYFGNRDADGRGGTRIFW